VKLDLFLIAVGLVALIWWGFSPVRYHESMRRTPPILDTRAADDSDEPWG
jgi:hypothetical protein